MGVKVGCAWQKREKERVEIAPIKHPLNQRRRRRGIEGNLKPAHDHE